MTGLGRPLDGGDGVAIRLRSLALEPIEVAVGIGGSYAESAQPARTTESARTAQIAGLLEIEPREVAIQDGMVAVPLPPGASRTLVLRP